MVSLVNKYYALLSPFSPTPLQDARALLSCVLGEDPVLVWRALSEGEEKKMAEFIEMRKKGVPVAYITGEKEFMSLPFYVNGHTLIPRPDTESIVETLIEMYKGQSPEILDVCCGSGCIGLSLAHYIPRSTVKMLDVSPEALKVAEKNALRLNLSDRVEIFRSDILKDEIKGGFDLIVSNPPYISSDILPSLEVSKSEPVLALDGGKDGLAFYRAIIPKAHTALKKGGTLAFEIGYDQADPVRRLMNEYFPSVAVKKDYGGNDRMVVAHLSDNP